MTAAETTVFSIELSRIRLRENGVVKPGASGTNALGAVLFYPRQGVPAVNSGRPMRLEDDERLDFTLEPYQNRLLFKEGVHHKAMLILEVSVIDEPSKIDKVFSELVGVAVSVAAGGVGGAIVSSVATSLAGSIFGSIEPERKVDVIGRGLYELRQDHPGGELTIPLVVPRDLEILEQKIGPDGRPQKTTKFLAQGTENGEIVVRLERL